MRRRTLMAMGLGGMLRAQTGGAPAFDVEVVRKSTAPSAPTPPGSAEGPPPPSPPPTLRPSPGGVTIEHATLHYCLVWAYSVRNSQVEGPQWVHDAYYNIYAKTGAPAEIPQVKKMLQTLLTARFRLVLHRDTRVRPVLGMVTAKGGAKLTPSKPGAAESRNVTSLGGGVLRVVATNTGLDFLEQFLSLPVWDPVVNLTGLSGGFDFTFERPPFRGQPDEIEAEVNAALQKQLGLRLEARKAPLETIVVESGNPEPIAN